MRKIFLIVAAIVCCANLFAAPVVVKEVYYAGPYAVNTPFLVDSTSVTGVKYSYAELLKTSIPLDKVWEASSSRTASNEVFPTVSSQGAELHMVGFYMGSDRFCKGTLSVSGAKYMEVYINGKAQAMSGGRANLSVIPKRYDVVVKYLTTPNDSVSLKISFDVKNGAHLETTLNPQRRYELGDVLHGKRVQSADISHDGKYLLVNYGEMFSNGKGTAETYIIERATGKTVYSRPVNAKVMKWMPKSNLVYYLRNADKGREIVTLNPATREEKVFASGIPGGSLVISPTEDYLILTSTDKGPEEKGDFVEILTPDDRQPNWRNRMFIYKYDLASGVNTRLTYGHTSTSLLNISDDGRKILFSALGKDITERPFGRVSLYIMDADTYAIDTVLTDGKYVNSASFSPDGRQLLVAGSGDAFDGVGLNVAEGQISNSYDSQLFLYNLSDKSVKPLTKDFDPSVKNYTWSRYDNRIYVRGEEGDRVQMFAINPSNGDVRKLKAEEDYVYAADIASSAPFMLYYGQSLNNSTRLHIYDLKKNSSKIVADFSTDKLRDVKLGETGDWNFESSNGGTISGRYYLPSDFDPAKKYPMLVYYYAGTNPTARVMEGVYSGHVYAALGYVVYVIQPSGATGFGQEFSARHVNAWGERTADDIIEGTKKFCDEHSFVNRDKIGCFGASYGGFMTQYLQTKTDIFAAAISHAGISSLASYWGEGYWGYGYSSVATADRYPWNAPEFYAMQSPLFNADKINTPILFLHGTVDTNVPIGESIQMFTALKMLGKETAFIQVKGENHIISDYNRKIKWSHTIYAWFAKWLQDSPDWWNAMYPPKDLE